MPRQKISKYIYGKILNAWILELSWLSDEVAKWTNLEELYLYNNQIGDKGAITIGNNSAWVKLKKLYLSSNRIGDEGATSIGSYKIWINLE